MVSESYFGDFFDHASKAANPASEPPVAPQIAMPTLFQPSQSSLFGMTASAAVTRSIEACGSPGVGRRRRLRPRLCCCSHGRGPAAQQCRRPAAAPRRCPCRADRHAARRAGTGRTSHMACRCRDGFHRQQIAGRRRETRSSARAASPEACQRSAESETALIFLNGAVVRNGMARFGDQPKRTRMRPASS